MVTNKNSHSSTATSGAKPPETRHAPTPRLPFRTAGVPPALSQPHIPAPTPPPEWRPIANARLESRLSHSKDGPLDISNRERIAIFSLNLSCVSAATSSPQNISNRNSRFTENPLNQALSPLTHFLTATKLAFSPFASYPAFLLAKAHPAI